jgi:glycosyltransferase involved in cell wall biosynthesis
MRILFISAFYPPHVVGGWEQLVQDINCELQQRGHITALLTSNYGMDAGPLAETEPGIERSLSLESDVVNYRVTDSFLQRNRRARRNAAITRSAIQRFRPDVIFVHVMWNLSWAVPWMAEQLLPQGVVYYIADGWPYAPDGHQVYWQGRARSKLRNLVKHTLAPLALRLVRRERRAYRLRFDRVLCVSQAMRRDLAERAGIPFEDMQVVYNGVELDDFKPAEKPKNGGLRLLYAGSLTAHKGVVTAVEAMGQLAQAGKLDGMTLTLVGSGHPAYEHRLRRQVEAAGIAERVFFHERVERQEMPALLREYDALVFPSTWQEPLARVVQEAMAAGLVVVGTPTGGTPEILKDGETGLVFPAGDAASLAGRLEQLSRDEGLRCRLAANARQVVEERFGFERMADEIEAYFGEMSS